MKKIVLVVVLSMLFGTIVYAQTPKMNANTKPFSIIERVNGKIDSVKKPNPDGGDFGSVSISESGGKKMDFYLIAKTRIFSDNSGPLTLEQLKKGDQVTVLYVITLRGTNEAIAVTQVR